MPTISSASASLADRLGSDLEFPITNNFIAISGVKTLLQDIQTLLLTIPGERVGRPTFGCDLRNQIWENIDQAAINGAASIQTALTNFEPRIILTAVDTTVNRNTDLVTFSIKFVIRNTDTALNLVFPFRVGTSLSFAS